MKDESAHHMNPILYANAIHLPQDGAKKFSTRKKLIIIFILLIIIGLIAGGIFVFSNYNTNISNILESSAKSS